ncbi:hypothetical protein MCOR25_009036 [Pyricularia grisea]|uniref:Uncharacterized protein n=1 Tax=Pyricularia grisea TaxID=148305 RepID=A0A6P8BAJ8_PYRGI|nr:uncharacterized protein PgNI_04144 [Pyricularia grisea]KAI6353317.1 hypothetical protein MCOR25_009036 [Pyricularia grisea]TLD12843.1 hypothetical protein PgNI_04144 [Pyricularia grisea]
MPSQTIHPSVLLLLLLLSLTVPTTGSFNWDITSHGIVSGWRWEKPWPHDDSSLMQFDELCRASATFPARQYKFSDLDADPVVKPYGPAIRDLATGRVYPGSWDGVNVKGPQRDVLLVEWVRIPRLARGWIQAQLETEDGRNRHFFRVVERKAGGAGGAGGSSGVVGNGVTDFTEGLQGVRDEEKVLITAPGELYQFLPLWVAEGSKCEDTLKDLTSYVATRAKDTCVVAWPTDHSRPLLEQGKKDINFTIEARLVRETEDGRTARIFWEKHHQNMQRLHRKIDREERAASRKGVERDRAAPHDEL